MYNINAGDVVLSVFVTLVVYGAYPVIFSSTRKQPITRKKFRLYCIIVTIAEWIMFSIVITSLGGRMSNGAPAVIWGGIFYKLGIRTLKQKSMLIVDEKDSSVPETSSPSQNGAVDTVIVESNPIILASESATSTEENAIVEKVTPMKLENEGKRVLEDGPEAKPIITSSVQFCYKCGMKLLEGSCFCSKCGTKVWVGDEK